MTICSQAIWPPVEVSDHAYSNLFSLAATSRAQYIRVREDRTRV